MLMKKTHEFKAIIGEYVYAWFRGRFRKAIVYKIERSTNCDIWIYHVAFCGEQPPASYFETGFGSNIFTLAEWKKRQKEKLLEVNDE